MDNSSRNVVKFITAITGAALLLMGARYYAESQKVARPAEVEAKAVPAAAVPEAEGVPTENDPLLDPDSDARDTENIIIEEDAEIIMGEPSMNLEQGSSYYDAPPAQGDPQTEQSQPE